jgi:hypothetical protein
VAQLRPKRLAQLEAKWVAQLRPFYLQELAENFSKVFTNENYGFSDLEKFIYQEFAGDTDLLTEMKKNYKF